MFLSVLVAVVAAGCFKDLDTRPEDPNRVTSDIQFKDSTSYIKMLAKVYAGLAVSGQQGPAGQADISGIDEGFGQYLRGYWYHQELTTDEAVIGWNDQTIKDFHAQKWTSNDGFLFAFYSRVFYQIAIANQYLRESTDDKLRERNVSASLQNEIKRYRAEVRFLRALSYWHAIDLFRNVPFATEKDDVGAFLAPQAKPEDLFNFIESEIKAVEGDLAAPRSNDYARADRAAAWMLLAKLYQNAEIYIGKNRQEDCLKYCDQIISSGYSLEQNFGDLFRADNHSSQEIIFPVAFDGQFTQTWGGMTFIIRAGIGGSMKATDSGVSGGWGGTRTTRQLVEKFPSDLTGAVVDFNPGRTALFARLMIPGSHQNFDASQTSNAIGTDTTINNRIFRGHLYFAQANNEVRFATIPSNTAPQFGDNGADGVLDQGGANIKIPTAGLHYFEVDLNTRAYKIERRDYVFVGTATNNQEVALTYNATTKFLEASAPLMVGNAVFKLKGSTTVALGDQAANGILTFGGKPIEIRKAGAHNIALDIDRPDYTYKLSINEFDRRGFFYTTGQTLDINDLTIFTDGYAVNKFKNITRSGVNGKSLDFPDTDFPMFRLADVYLMAAEAVLRGAGGGDKTRAANYFNKVRERAYQGTSANLNSGNIDLNTILDERARELYWECHRRTDLVRFGQFTDGNYLWQWKGGVKDGERTENFRNIFPIPAADLNANRNLRQNNGY